MRHIEKSKEQLVAEIKALQDKLAGTEKVKAALKVSQQRLTDIINFLPDATFAIDLDGKVIAWNKAIVAMSGVPAADILGKGDYEYSLPFYGQRRPILIDLVFFPSEEVKKKYHFVEQKGDMLLAEADVSVRGEEIRNLWGKAGPLYDGNGAVIGAIESIRDITDQRKAERERKELEEHLQRAEKMKALGALAGGVAHDLNNVLGVIIGYAELIAHSEQPGSTGKKRADNILKSGEKAAAIVQDLLTLARRGVFNKKTFNINTIIEDFLNSAEYMKIAAHHPYSRVRTDLSPDLDNILGSRIHFEKSFFNLVCNGFEAMPDGGILSVITSNQYLSHPPEGYDEIREGEYVTISISDSGEGISTEDLDHIFEPFYTKKVMGKSGTGLGLAVVWGTVGDHDGYITIRSKEGMGSTFTLYLPVTYEQVIENEIQVDITEYMGRGESILIIDDVHEQRELAAEMLNGLQYKVTLVGSGEEGVAYLQNHKVDLVILDMIMDPGMDGLDTFREIVVLHPKQRAIIVSGFAETKRVVKTQALGAGSYLRKPYVQEQLGLAVRKELDRR